jgi:SAM-dependent methyltransferase
VVGRWLAEIPSARSFLEVGCGQGALATLLARRFEYVGYEPDTASFRVAHRRLSHLGLGSVVNAVLPPVPERTFDLVGAFEVLEHQADDRASLAAWVRWVRPGGHLILSVPAHPERFGRADRDVGHFRRYRRSDLEALLTAAGLLKPRVVVYGFPLGFGLEWVRNHLAAMNNSHHAVTSDERTAASGRWFQPHDSIAPMIWLGTLPFQVMQRPFTSGELGTGFIARAQRPREDS